MPLSEKMHRSKLVIDNRGSLEDLQAKVITVYNKHADCNSSCICFHVRMTLSNAQFVLCTQVKAVSDVLKDNNTFRGMLSSPLAIFIAVFALVPNTRRYAQLSWQRITHGHIKFGQAQ